MTALLLLAGGGFWVASVLAVAGAAYVLIVRAFTR
jgi:hypothetical protein